MLVAIILIPPRADAVTCDGNGFFPEVIPAHVGGRWSCPFNMDIYCTPNCPQVPNNPAVSTYGRPAIHLILTRGRSGYHSRLWYYSETKDDQAHYWKWNPSVPLDPNNPFQLGNVVSIPTDVEIFCGGHSVLPDGRVLITGGQDGINFAGIRQTGLISTAGTWLPDGEEMYLERWYPTQTTMSDGRVLITGGDRYPRGVLFGGVDASGTILASPILLEDESDPE
jgi:hypothetical protein